MFTISIEILFTIHIFTSNARELADKQNNSQFSNRQIKYTIIFALVTVKYRNFGGSKNAQIFKKNVKIS